MAGKSDTLEMKTKQGKTLWREEFHAYPISNVALLSGYGWWVERNFSTACRGERTLSGCIFSRLWFRVYGYSMLPNRVERIPYLF